LEQRAKRLRLIPRLLCFILVFFVLLVVHVVLFKFLNLNALFNNWIFIGLFEFAIACLAVYLIGHFIDRRKFSDFGFHIDKHWLRQMGLGILLGGLLMGGIFLVEYACGWVKVSGFLETNTLLSSLPTPGYFWSQFFQALVYYFFAAAFEEVLFRAFLLINISEGLHNEKISKKQALWIAAILTSIIFGLAHLGNPHPSWVAALNIFFSGIMISLGLIYDGELALPIGLHFSWNFFQGVIFGFPISGTLSPANLIQIQQLGPQFATGGDFGPEAACWVWQPCWPASSASWFISRNRNRAKPIIPYLQHVFYYKRLSMTGSLFLLL
jgi:membrane protease YdiL (CAAX protease family)